MAKITLGGERLGSGKKLEVNIPEFNRSSHDQGFVFTTDQAFGTLVPALCNIGTRGDVFYLDDITSLVRTLPTNGPVFGSVKQQIDVFCAPVRLYIGALHNNATGIGLKMAQIKFPVEKHITTVYGNDLTTKNPNLLSVAPDSLSAYLGSTGSKTGNTYQNLEYDENAIMKLFYWDIYKNYYANKQEEEGVVIRKGQVEYSGGPVERAYISIDAGARTYNVAQHKNGYSQGLQDVLSHRITSGSTVYISTTRQLTETEYNNIRFGVKNIDSNNIVYTNPNVEANGWSRAVTANAVIYTYEPTSEKLYFYLAGKDGLISGVDWATQEYSIETERFDLENIDKMREKILSAPIGTPLVINEDKNTTGVPYNVETEQIRDKDGNIRESRSLTMCGLGIKCHLSDMYNNWLQTDWIDGENGINELTSIDTSDGKFTINEFILDYKLFKMMNRIAISDGSYDAWQTAVYGQEGRVITESPVYCGGYSSEIAFNEVISQSATEEEPLGSLAGRGAQQDGTRQGGKGIKIVCDEAMLIMAISSFTPRTTYSQTREWWTQLESMDDLHKPDLDGIAFQNLTQGSFADWADNVNTNGTISEKVVGKQTPWVEYTTAVNKSFGDFAAGMSLEHLVLNRSYQSNGPAAGILNVTTYIDPTEFNVIFADKELTAKPFWVQIAFNLTSRRKMSAVQIPNL